MLIGKSRRSEAAWALRHTTYEGYSAALLRVAAVDDGGGAALDAEAMV
jgi:hypothetical protein